MDEIRGFAVFCMVFYHGFYTLAFLFQSEIGLFWLRFFTPAEPWFAGAFILIAGISSDLSHSNLVRGLKLLGVALVVTFATWIVVPDELILFGILHFLSVCMIVFGLLQPKLKRMKFSRIPVAVCALLFAVTYALPKGYLGFPPHAAIRLPAALYSTNWLAPLGFNSPNFTSADYFPLLPWIFIFAAGTVIGKLAAQGKFPKWMYISRVPLLSWLGKHALVIYVLHQPVIFGVGEAISYLIGK